jgi:hypothetical protein
MYNQTLVFSVSVLFHRSFHIAIACFTVSSTLVDETVKHWPKQSGAQN